MQLDSLIEDKIQEFIRPLENEIKRLEENIREINTEDRYLNKKELCLYLGYKHPAYINNLVKQGKLPPPENFDLRSVRWSRKRVDKWLRGER